MNGLFIYNWSKCPVFLVSALREFVLCPYTRQKRFPTIGGTNTQGDLTTLFCDFH